MTTQASASTLSDEERKKQEANALAIRRYLSNIDQVFKLTKDEATKHLKLLDAHMLRDPEKFQNEYRNLKSYIEDLEEMEEERRAKKSFALEQIPQ